MKGARHTVRLDWRFAVATCSSTTSSPRRRHALKQLVLPSRAWKTWTFTHRLADAGRRHAAARRLHRKPLGPVATRFVPDVPVRRRPTRCATHFVRSQAIACRPRSTFGNRFTSSGSGSSSCASASATPTSATSSSAPPASIWLIDLDKSRFHRTRRVRRPLPRRAWKQLLRSVAAV